MCLEHRPQRGGTFRGFLCRPYRVLCRRGVPSAAGAAGCGVGALGHGESAGTPRKGHQEGPILPRVHQDLLFFEIC